MNSAPSPTAAKTRTALYGGAFDPLHNGHLATIAALLNSGVIDEVFVIPSGDRPDKPTCTSAEVRLEMCSVAVREAFANDPRVVVSDLHSAQRVGYATIDLVRYFHSDPSREISVVVGHELLGELHTWKEADALKREARFVVVKRPGVPPPAAPEGWAIAILPVSYEAGVAVSSTALRSMLKEGRSCAGLMPSSIERFCRERGLYRGL